MTAAEAQQIAVTSTGTQLRVLHVLGELRRSGAEMMLAHGAEAMRVDGVALAALSTGTTIGEMAQPLGAAGVETLHLPFAARPGFLIRLVKEARRFDLVHVHTERASFWLCSALRLAGLPVVRTVHSSFLFEGRLRLVRSWQRRLLARYGVSFIAIGREVAANEESRFHLGTTVVSNWVPARFHQAADDRVPPTGEPMVLSVGNCGEPKNHTALIEAVGMLRRKGIPVRYRHVGSEVEAVEDERGLARSTAGEAVDFVGPDDPLPHLKAATLFVMPSRREGFGLAALEAIASGTPVLLADAPGLREFDVVPGIWWASPDAAGLAEAMERILSMAAAERESSAATAAAFVTSEFDARLSHERTLALYRSHTRAGSVQ